MSVFAVGILFWIFLIVVWSNDPNVVEYCPIDSLCNQFTSYSYPLRGYSEVFYYDLENSITSTCLQLSPIKVQNNLPFDSNSIFCNSSTVIDDQVLTFQYFYLPFVVPEGLYNIYFFEISRALAKHAIISRTYYFMNFNASNSLPFSPFLAEPKFGTLKSRKMKVLLTPDSRVSPYYDGIFLSICGIFSQLLPPQTDIIETQSITEPGSWFLTFLQVKEANLLQSLIIDLQLQDTSEPDVLPILFGSKQLPKSENDAYRQISQEDLARIEFGLPYESYMEFILSDQDILNQRLFYPKQSISNFEQLYTKLSFEKKRWKNKLTKLFQERGFLLNSAVDSPEISTTPKKTLDNSSTRRRKLSIESISGNPHLIINPPSSSSSRSRDHEQAHQQEEHPRPTAAGQEDHPQQTRRAKKMNICISTGINMDGQKKIWLQQSEFMNQEKYHFVWIVAITGAKTLETLKATSSELFRANSLLTQLYQLQSKQSNIDIVDSYFNAHLLQQEDLEEFPEDENFSAAQIWQQNRTLLYEYIHYRYMKANGNLMKITPSWCYKFYQIMAQNYLDNSCNVMIYGNSRGYTADVFITDVGKSLRIPTMTELLNLYLDERSIPDIIVAPSLHSLKHESIQLPISSNQLLYHYQQRPLEIVISPSVDYQRFEFHYQQKLLNNKPMKLAKSCAIENNFQFPFPLKREEEVFIRHYPCVLIGFVARLSAEKNPGLVLQAAYFALQQFPFLRFRFIGDGILKPHLEALARRLGIDHAVDFTGWISSEDLPKYLADLDIVINPSLRGWSETFCISNIEIMSMGIPIITFAVGGIGEYIHKPADVEVANRDEEQIEEEEMTATIDGNEGIPFHFESFYDERKEFRLFDVSDNAVILNSAHPQAISDAILALVTNPGLARMIGENGRNSILPYFSVERQMRQYENLYDAIFELLP